MDKKDNSHETQLALAFEEAEKILFSGFKKDIKLDFFTSFFNSCLEIKSRSLAGNEIKALKKKFEVETNINMKNARNKSNETKLNAVQIQRIIDFLVNEKVFNSKEDFIRAYIALLESINLQNKPLYCGLESLSKIIIGSIPMESQLSNASHGFIKASKAKHTPLITSNAFEVVKKFSEASPQQLTALLKNFPLLPEWIISPLNALAELRKTINSTQYPNSNTGRIQALPAICAINLLAINFNNVNSTTNIKNELADEIIKCLTVNSYKCDEILFQSMIEILNKEDSNKIYDANGSHAKNLIAKFFNLQKKWFFEIIENRITYGYSQNPVLSAPFGRCIELLLHIKASCERLRMPTLENIDRILLLVLENKNTPPHYVLVKRLIEIFQLGIKLDKQNFPLLRPFAGVLTDLKENRIILSKNLAGICHTYLQMQIYHLFNLYTIFTNEGNGESGYINDKRTAEELMYGGFELVCDLAHQQNIIVDGRKPDDILYDLCPKSLTDMENGLSQFIGNFIIDTTKSRWGS